MALDTMVDAAQILNGLGANSYRVLLTNVPPAPQKDGSYARQALQELNLPLFKCQIRSAKAFKKASERGVTVDRAPAQPRKLRLSPPAPDERGLAHIN